MAASDGLMIMLPADCVVLICSQVSRQSRIQILNLDLVPKFALITIYFGRLVLI